tara:strand:- start:3093 stop:4553 length:1461 start_codon:yes stop_codon:yes gene_type:complete
MIIGISGKIGSGKTTAAEYIIQQMPIFEHEFFSRKVKEVVACLTNTSVEYQFSTEGKASKSEGFDITNGEFQQKIGEGLRNSIQSDIWVKSTLQNCKDKFVIISDVRYPNELKAIQKMGGKVIRLIRKLSDEENKTLVGNRNINHPSETALDSSQGKFDYIYSNNSSLDDFHNFLLKIMDIIINESSNDAKIDIQSWVLKELSIARNNVIKATKEISNSSSKEDNSYQNNEKQPEHKILLSESIQNTNDKRSQEKLSNDIGDVLSKQGQNHCELQWITPNSEKFILRNARISSKVRDSGKVGLINYLIKHGHWSPFETASMCVEIVTSRTIARQILRHRSFSFQEFSQRYQDVEILTDKEIEEEFVRWEARTEHEKNRQSSVETDDWRLIDKFHKSQKDVWLFANDEYKNALKSGIAKEQARCLLPEGLTKTRMCMSGTIRSWIHYIDLRSKEDTQYEHRIIANLAKSILIKECPNIATSLGWKLF